MDCQVESHELSEHLILVSNHLGEVVGPILVSINGAWSSAISVEVVVDGSSNHGQLGNHVHGVLECGLPVLGLVDTLAVRLGELGLGVERGHGGGELGHGVEVGGEVVQHGDHVAGQLGAPRPVLAEAADLLLGGDVAGDQEPEQTLGQRLLTAGRLGQQLLALGDGVAAEPDALVSVEHGGLGHQPLHAHAAVEGVHGDLADLGVAVLLPKCLDLLLGSGDLLGEGGPQIRRIAALGDRLGGGGQQFLEGK